MQVLERRRVVCRRRITMLNGLEIPYEGRKISRELKGGRAGGARGGDALSCCLTCSRRVGGCTFRDGNHPRPPSVPGVKGLASARDQTSRVQCGDSRYLSSIKMFRQSPTAVHAFVYMSKRLRLFTFRRSLWLLLLLLFRDCSLGVSVFFFWCWCLFSHRKYTLQSHCHTFVSHGTKGVSVVVGKANTYPHGISLVRSFLLFRWRTSSISRSLSCFLFTVFLDLALRQQLDACLGDTLSGTSVAC